MGEAWRFVDAGAVTPVENVAMMPVLSRQVAETGRPVVMTSVWGQTHLTVGWFDDVDATLDLDAAAAAGVAVIRRPMFGGGTAFYDAGCAVMWGYLLPKGGEWDDLDAALTRFVPAFEDTLRRLDLAAVQFEGSSDLRWNGRKLGAMTTQDVIACISSRSKRQLPIWRPMSLGAACFDVWYSHVGSAGGADASHRNAV